MIVLPNWVASAIVTWLVTVLWIKRKDLFGI